MKPYKLAFKNIKKSIKDYAIYFFTLILGVAIFYVFNSIESQTIMMQVSASTRNIIKLMTNILSAVSVFVSFILGFLIIYASRFLMKRRNKEFGIYLTLGMSKQKVSLILFFETLLIGIASLAVGLGLGVILSQVMSILVANLFEADLTNFAFIFSKSAFIKTLIYFSIMYLFVMIFNTISISKCKLIDLLQASKKSEEVKLKNPILCIFIFILSLAALSYAYYLVTGGVDKLTDFSEIFKPIILGSVSTFFIFWSVSGLVLRIVGSIKHFYYKGLNSFTLRQISSKINTTVMSMTIICLMLFVTICVLSSSLSIKNSMTANLTTLAPVDIELEKKLDLIDEERYSKEQIEDSKLSVVETLNKLDFDTNTYLKDIVTFNIYKNNNVTLKTTLGTEYEKIKQEYPYLQYNNEEEIIKLSDYNKIAKLFSLEEYTLSPDEYILVADFDSYIEIRNKGLLANTPLTIEGKNYYPKYQECKNGFLEMSSNHINIGFFIVPDEAVEETRRERNVLLANYKASTKEEKENIENIILNLDNHPYAKNINLDGTTKLSIYEASVGLGALVTFIGLYLGIIFLISSAAVLALKELSESSDNKERFAILRRIGADEKVINKALYRQIAIFFMVPLILAIIHSIFGIIFCNYILATFGNEQLLPSIAMTAIFMVLIYGGYFLITYFCSKNIIKEKI